MSDTAYQVRWFLLENALVRGNLVNLDSRTLTFSSKKEAESAIEKDRIASEEGDRPPCGYDIYELTQ